VPTIISVAADRGNIKKGGREGDSQFILTIREGEKKKRGRTLLKQLFPSCHKEGKKNECVGGEKVVRLPALLDQNKKGKGGKKYRSSSRRLCSGREKEKKGLMKKGGEKRGEKKKEETSRHSIRSFFRSGEGEGERGGASMDSLACVTSMREKKKGGRPPGERKGR